MKQEKIIEQNIYYYNISFFEWQLFFIQNYIFLKPIFMNTNKSNKTEYLILLIDQLIDSLKALKSGIEKAEINPIFFYDHDLDYENFSLVDIKILLEDLQSKLADELIGLLKAKIRREEFQRKLKEDPDWNKPGHGGFFS